MKQKIFRARSLGRIVTQALGDEVFLLTVLKALDRPLDVLGRHHSARITVALNLQRGHFQRAHAKRVNINGGRETTGDCVHSDSTVLRCNEVYVLDVLSIRLHMMINCIRRYTTNFN